MSGLDLVPFAEAKSDQLVADDLIGGPRTIKITRVAGDEDTKKVSIFFEGDGGKPFQPCKTVIRVLMGLWGKYASEYAGRSLTLYRDADVEFGGIACGGIRVSHASHIDADKAIMVAKTRGKKSNIIIKPLKDAPAPTGADEQALALAAITEAANGGTEALSTAWRQKWIAPHREALQLDLDRLKLVAQAKDKPPHDPETGEITEPQQDAFGLEVEPSPAEEAVAKAIAAANAAKTPEALAKIVKDAEQHKLAVPDELAVKLEVAFDENRRRLETAEVA